MGRGASSNKLVQSIGNRIHYIVSRYPHFSYLADNTVSKYNRAHHLISVYELMNTEKGFDRLFADWKVVKNNSSMKMKVLGELARFIDEEYHAPDEIYYSKILVTDCLKVLNANDLLEEKLKSWNSKNLFPRLMILRCRGCMAEIGLKYFCVMRISGETMKLYWVYLSS